jgi:deazaflavin-dependent oxidoreductase (nitroreductase family)
MPIPTVVTTFNRTIANPIIGRFAGRVAPLAIVEHRGRASGTRYRTPVMAFPTNGEMMIALTYGAGVDWVKNVLAAGECDLEYRRRRIQLVEPRLEHGTPVEPFPWVVRPMLRLLRVHDVLRLRAVDGG